MSRAPKPDVPEDFNREQDEESQAPDIEAELRDGVRDEQGQTERPYYDDPGAILPDDVPDLVDKMNEMFVSGRIDNDAFVGEPMHDDEDLILGNTDDDDVDGDNLRAIDDERP